LKVAVIYNASVIKDSDVINVFGAPTKEWYSPKIVDKVASALEKGGHNVRVVEGNMNLINELQNFMPRVMKGEIPGIVFNMAYGIQGQSRYTHIPSMLEMVGIPYVGSGPAGHAIALDKVNSKIVFLRHKLPTPPFWVSTNPIETFHDLPFPVVVKPRSEAVSIGICVCRNRQELKEAVAVITREFQQQALIETFIPGREFAVSLLGNGPDITCLPIVEIDLQGDPDAIQTLDDKTLMPRGKICPADLSPGISEKMQGLAKEAFSTLGLCDFARVDFRMDAEEGLHILEINSMASLNLTGSFVHSARVAGMDFDCLINRILDNAAQRYFGDAYFQTKTRDAAPGVKSDPLHVRIRGYLRSHLATIIAYTGQMVSMNTFVHNIEGVNRIGSWLAGRFQQMGFQRHIYPQTEVGHLLYFSNHSEPRSDILLLGHLDTFPDDQNYRPFHEDHGRLYGTGVAECKGGLAVILAALQALRFARALRNIRCGILLTTDDSLGGRFSKNVIAEIAQKSKCVIDTVYGNIDGGISTSCSGTQQYHIEITNPKDGRNKKIRNVMEGLSQKILAWLKLSLPEKGVMVTISSISARMNPGLSSDHATVYLTARFNDKNQGAALDEQIRKIAKKGYPGRFQVRIKVDKCRLPIAETDQNLDFFEKVRALAKRLEVAVKPAHRDFSSNICHVPDTLPVLGGFGPVGEGSRSLNEHIICDSLIDRSALLALVIREAAE
jgi:D-alanine-D-alanine ligase